MKHRLDSTVFRRGLTSTRSQAENYIKLGLVSVNNRVIKKPAHLVSEGDAIILAGDQYVSRAALKLASIAGVFGLDFHGKTVLDVGSSTGGFTDYALQHKAKKVFSIDVGTDQLHPTLRHNSRVEVHEKTDIRDFADAHGVSLRNRIDMIVADVSFISLAKILPSLKQISSPQTQFIMMCKPQFEAGKEHVHKGVIKNSAVRRQVLKKFEDWLQSNKFIILQKADSHVAGTKGNVERFYLLKSI